MKENRDVYFKYYIKSILLNGGWKLIALSTFLIILVLIWENFTVDFTSFNNASFLIFLCILVPIAAALSRSCKEIKIMGNKLLYKKFFQRKWNKIYLVDISRVCHFHKPLKKYAIFPKTVIYGRKGKKDVTLSYLLDERDIYKVLSKIHDAGIETVIYEERKEIDETEYYTPG